MLRLILVMLGKRYFEREKNMENEIVKIRTKKNRILTITISKKTDTHISGHDRDGVPVKLPLADIDRMLPTKEVNKTESFNYYQG